MGKSQRFPVGFPPIIRGIIKEQVGVLGNSESEVVKNIVMIFCTERDLIKSFEKRRMGGRK